MELHRYLDVLYRRKVVVLAVVVAALGVAAAGSLLLPERWSATAALRVDPSSALVSGSVRADDMPYRDRLVNTYHRMAETMRLGEQVTQRLGGGSPVEVEFEDVANTNVVDVSASTDSARRAADGANLAAEALVAAIRGSEQATRDAAAAEFQRQNTGAEQSAAQTAFAIEELRRSRLPADRERLLRLREELSGKRAALAAARQSFQVAQSTRDARANAVSLAWRATVPTEPDSRHLMLALALGAALGLLGGAGFALVAENLSTRVRDGDELEAAVHAPLLAAVPVMRRADRKAGAEATPAGEAVRRLRTTLLLPPYAAYRTILVTSPEEGEGKTTLVAALGRSLAEAGRSVVLVDADLREPDLHRVLGMRGDRGLAQLAAAREPDPGAVLAHCHGTPVPGLSLLAAGRATDDPATLLGSEGTSLALTELSRHFGFVLVDAPAVLAAPDALAVAAGVDGVLLVAGSRSTRESLRVATRDLQRAGAPPFGVVVTRARERDLYATRWTDTPHAEPAGVAR